jgi:hypothetical protein
MNPTIFIIIWFVAMAFLLFSSITFFFAKKPEYTFNVLIQHRPGYWYKRLDEVVPSIWVKPIYYSALTGAMIAATDVIFLICYGFLNKT